MSVARARALTLVADRRDVDFPGVEMSVARARALTLLAYARAVRPFVVEMSVARARALTHFSDRAFEQISNL